MMEQDECVFFLWMIIANNRKMIYQQQQDKDNHDHNTIETISVREIINGGNWIEPTSHNLLTKVRLGLVNGKLLGFPGRKTQQHRAIRFPEGEPNW